MRYILILAALITFQSAAASDSEEIKLKRFAEQGTAEAEYNLALYYELQAANGCDINHEYNPSNVYADCEDSPQSLEIKRLRFDTDAKAVHWYRKAANQGYAKAQASLGIMYDFGKGVEENDSEAVKWFLKAARQGQALAQHNLAIMYEEGTGVSQDYLAAIDWYTKAAMQDSVKSQHNLGLMYQKGTGVSKSDAQAFKWFSKAASHGSSASQNNLALMYAMGEAIQPSMISAYVWWKMSSDQGQKTATENLALLTDMMPPVAIKEAQALATKCYESNYKDCD